MFENGQGVTSDIKQAAQWYQKAALQGNSDALYKSRTSLSRKEKV